MPTVYNGGTANFAALMPYQNFAQKAAYKQQEVAYLNEINRIEDEKMARVNDMQKNIADSAAALAAMPVEPQDVSRLRTEIESKTADILKEMRTSGDPESWLRNNGRTAAVDLTRKVLTGDVLPNMTINKASMAKINDDLANGRKIRPMDVVMADGSVQKLDSKTAIEKFRNKEAIRIQYDSGYDVPDVAKVMQFTATNDNPDYYYAKDKNTVTFNQYKNLLSRDVAAKNMSEQELDAYAKETYNPGFKWNNNDIRYREMALNEQRAARQQSQAASDTGDSLYNQAVTRPYGNLISIAVANKTQNIGFNSQAATKSDAMAYSRLLSRNKQTDSGLIDIDANQRGYWYTDQNGRNVPLKGGANLIKFKPNGNAGLYAAPSSSKDPSRPNLILGGFGYLPMKENEKEEDATARALKALGLTPEQAAQAKIDFIGIDNVGGGNYIKIGGLGVNHTIPTDRNEITAESGIVNSTKYESEGK